MSNEEWRLDTRRVGRRVIVFDELDSTNTRAALLANDRGNDGLVILARTQTAGRGQYGRSWVCVPGTGVLLSALLFPPPPLRRPALMTALAAVAVCETIQAAAELSATIKWPNDVLIDGRKVCGILIEQARGTVIGIGLNVNQGADHFAAAGLPEAGSLALCAGRALDCGDVARELIARLDDHYDRLCRGDLATLEACWRPRFGLLDKQVKAECHDGTYHGRLREVAWDGVELELPSGDVLGLKPEAVRHLEPVE